MLNVRPATIRRVNKLTLFLLPLVAVLRLTAADANVALKMVAGGFVSPTVLAPLPDGTLLVGDQAGTIHLLSKEGKREETPVLSLRDKLAKLNEGAFDERGLLGVAVHPQFAQNHKIYVFYSAPLRASAPTNFNCTSHLSEFTLNNGRAGDERLLLQIDKPQFNHNGGRLAFGPDGFLYISAGDGGGGNDSGPGHSPQGNAQDTSKLLGKILRIDVNGKASGKEYALPQDNPFARGGGAPEIFAYGLRNPWGMTFDRGGSHELFVGDVGQDSWEEIDIVVKGGNYGWRIREGFVCFDPKKPKSPPADCPEVGADGKPLIPPIVAYKSFRKFPRDPDARGISITGGYVYRGKALPPLVGKYIFADWSRDWIKADGVLYVASRGSNDQWTMEPLPVAGHPDGAIKAYITAFGQDADGELYVMTNSSNMLKGNTGKVWKLVAAAP